MKIRTLQLDGIGISAPGGRVLVGAGERFAAVMLVPATRDPAFLESAQTAPSDEQRGAARCWIRLNEYAERIPLESGVPFYGDIRAAHVGAMYAVAVRPWATFVLYEPHDPPPLSCAPSTFRQECGLLTTTGDAFTVGQEITLHCEGWEWARIAIVGSTTVGATNSGAVRCQGLASGNVQGADGVLWERRCLFNSSWPREQWIQPLHGCQRLTLTVRRATAAVDVACYYFIVLGRGPTPGKYADRRININQGAIGAGLTVQIGCLAHQGWNSAAIRGVAAGAAGNHVVTLNSIYVSDNRTTDPASEVAVTDTVVVGTSVSAFATLLAAAAAAADCYRIDILNTAAGASTATNGAVHLRGP